MILLRFFCDLGLVNQPVKFNTKSLITFEQDYQNLFKTKANRANDALPLCKNNTNSNTVSSFQTV